MDIYTKIFVGSICIFELHKLVRRLIQNGLAQLNSLVHPLPLQEPIKFGEDILLKSSQNCLLDYIGPLTELLSLLILR